MNKIFFTLPFLTTLALADVSPNYQTIFSLNHDTKLFSCATLGGENYYCERPINGKTLPHFTAMGGEGEFYVILHSSKELGNSQCQFEASDKTLFKASCSGLTNIREVFQKNTPVEEGSYVFHPQLTEIFTAKDSKVTKSINGVLSIKASPVNYIGELEVRPNLEDARLPDSKTGIKFSYPGKGEKKLSSKDLLKLKDFKFQVLRKDQDRYLIQINSDALGVIDFQNTGVAHEQRYLGERSYSWVEADGISFSFIPKKDTSLELTKFILDKGEDFKKADEIWTSFKVHAVYPDFDKAIEEGSDSIPLKKTYTQDIFMPLLNKDKELNMWPEWNPGC